MIEKISKYIEKYYLKQIGMINEVIKLKIELLKATIEYEKIKSKNNKLFKNGKTRKVFILKEE